MSDAFTSACAALGLASPDSPATQVVAERVIKYAEEGVRSRTELYALVIEEFVQEGIEYVTRDEGL